MSAITFNGKTYNSVDEMPANEREAFLHLTNAFADKNGNGIPDFMEGDIAENVRTAFKTNFRINGQTYKSMDEIPPELRTKIQDALQKMNKLGISTTDPAATSTPDNIPVSPEPLFQTGQAAMVESRPFVEQGYTPAIEEEKGTNPAIWLLIGLALLLCIAGAMLATFYYLNMH